MSASMSVQYGPDMTRVMSSTVIPVSAPVVIRPSYAGRLRPLPKGPSSECVILRTDGEGRGDGHHGRRRVGIAVVLPVDGADLPILRE